MKSADEGVKLPGSGAAKTGGPGSRGRRASRPGAPKALPSKSPPPLFNQLAGQYMKLVVARPGGALSVSKLLKMPK